MARGAQLAIPATTATKIADNPSSDSNMYVTVINGASASFYGGSNVTNTVYGFTHAAAAVKDFVLAPEDELYVYNVAGATLGVFTSP